MKLLILIIGLSHSSNCEGQITKNIINIAKAIYIADKTLNFDTPRPANYTHVKLPVDFLIPNIDSPKIANYTHVKIPVDSPRLANYTHEKIPIDSLISIIKSLNLDNPLKLYPIYNPIDISPFPIFSPSQELSPVLKFKYIPIKLIDLTYNLPDVISYNYSSSIFHLIATKNPLYHDYNGFTLTKTTTNFSFNNQNFRYYKFN